MLVPIFADVWQEYWPYLMPVGLLGIALFLVVLFICFNFVQLWIQAYLAGARIGFLDMIRMQLLKLDYATIVKLNIAMIKAGLKVTPQEMEAHLLSRGRLEKVVRAVIAAHKAGMDLPWRVAAAIDLAGRDVEEAVRRSVDPKVIDCPDPAKGRTTLDGVCRNGIQLRARARVTVRTKLDRLIGGATEETIIARVGEGIVKAIGSAEHHTDVLANPSMISQAVLDNALDAQTAFEIVSIDIAEIDVGQNIGANLQADQAAADLRVAQANAEKRRALAVAMEQEMRANVEQNRAHLVLAEAEIPKAISEAFREGHLGVMDYYQLRNLQSDTQMRNAIAGVNNGGERSERTADSGGGR
ncbi:MAG: flotillin-like protein FloA [Gemmataceae bacterium]